MAEHRPAQPQLRARLEGLDGWSGEQRHEAEKGGVMRFLLVLLLIFVVLLAILLGVSVGVALLLHRLVPAVGLEMALLVAVIAVGQTLLLFGRVMNSLPMLDVEAESESERPPIVVLDREVALPRRRRKRT